MWEPEEQYQWKQWYEGKMDLKRAISRVETIARRDSWRGTEQARALEVVLAEARKHVPEEPKDHIILFKSRLPPHEWQVNKWSDGTAVPYTKTEAEHHARGEAGRYIVVKVPV